MSEIFAVRKITFDSAHRVMLHESKCKKLHGHTYALHVYAKALPDSKQLDSLGRVIDFGVLKEKVKGWIDENWDHNCILSIEDRAVRTALESLPIEQTPYILPYNPTAENMAFYLLDIIFPKLMDGTGVEIIKVVLWETPNCFVEVCLNG